MYLSSRRYIFRDNSHSIHIMEIQCLYSCYLFCLFDISMILIFTFDSCSFFKIQILFNDSFLDIFFTVCSIISYFIKSKKTRCSGWFDCNMFYICFTSYPIDLRYCKNCVNVLDDAIARSRSSSISVLRVGFFCFFACHSE